MPGITVAVTGGRDYSNRDKVFAVLDEIHAARTIKWLVHGGATGADSLAVEWSWKNHVLGRGYNARWEKHGKKAGPIRNTYMLADARPHLVVAFPGGRGTADCVAKAKKRGIEVLEVFE